jgi:uncharacterized membrane protein
MLMFARKNCNFSCFISYFFVFFIVKTIIIKVFLKGKMVRLLKLIFISILGGGLVWSLSFAKTLYVKDSITITARTGPATD